MYIYIYTRHIHIYIYICLYSAHVFSLAYIHTYVRTYVRTFVQYVLYIHTYTRVCVYTYIYIYIYREREQKERERERERQRQRARATARARDWERWFEGPCEKFRCRGVLMSLADVPQNGDRGQDVGGCRAAARWSFLNTTVIWGPEYLQ